LDMGYIFCNDETPNKCWMGVELSEILQEESLKRLGVKINLWAWRHIIIGITKAHLETVAPFFARNEKLCREPLETNIYLSIFPWQAGHQRRVSVSIYGLDAAFPGQLQPALLRFYREISKIWHIWVGVEKEEGGQGIPAELVDSETQTTPRKESTRLNVSTRTHMGGNDGDGDDDGKGNEEPPTCASKRQKLVDSEIETTPQKMTAWLDVRPEDSPLTRSCIEKAEKTLKAMREIVELRRKSRDLFNVSGT
jgi:hypothetical protein